MMSFFSSFFSLRPKSIFVALLCGIVMLCLASCQKKTQTDSPVPDTSKGTYFSVIDFTKDQWQTFKGQPYVIKQYSEFNGKKDSVMLSALTMKWSAIFQTFFATDISDPKFLDQYDFSMFEEPTTEARTFTYTAKNPELFTQKLQILADYYNNKIRSIYIETQKQDFWSTTTQKLYYAPVKTILIQEHKDPLIGSQKEMVLEYKFL